MNHRNIWELKHNANGLLGNITINADFVRLVFLVLLIGTSLFEKHLIQINNVAWYQEEEVKFSDILASIRTNILRDFCKERVENQTAQNSDEGFINRIIDLFIKAA